MQRVDACGAVVGRCKAFSSVLDGSSADGRPPIRWPPPSSPTCVQNTELAMSQPPQHDVLHGQAGGRAGGQPRGAESDDALIVPPTTSTRRLSRLTANTARWRPVIVSTCCGLPSSTRT